MDKTTNRKSNFPYFLRLCFLVIPLAGIIMTGCAKRQASDDDENHPSPPALVPVKTTEIAQGTIDVVVSATGKTEALKTVKVFSPIAGKVTSLKVLEGSAVKAGDIIAVIQTKESYAAISGAEAILQSATTPEAKQEAQRALNLAQTTQSAVSVRAKFDGVVSTRNVSEGELVSESAEIVTLLDLSTIVFTADVPLQDLPSIHQHQSGLIRFQSLPGENFQATVDAINPQSDIQSQTVKVRLRFDRLSGRLALVLKTDMIGTASIITGAHKNAFLVPKSALLRDDENHTFSIVIMTDDSLAKSISVTVGQSSDSTVEVISDQLQKGMNIITEGNYALTDSTKVTIATEAQ